MGVRTIDIEKCTGCRLCLLQCPMDVFRMDTYRPDKEEVSPCQEACPAGVDMRGYIYLFTQRRYDEAIARIRQALPLPAVTGHICFHPCETECARKEVDEAVNINAVERFVADYWLNEKAKPIPKVHEEKVAIVGSGPAGLAAAYELVKMGYPVTVFESMSQLGGMLRVGIPEFRLPKDMLDAQINYIKDMGAEFRTNITVGKDLTLDDLQKEGYRSVFFAVGAQLSRKLDIKGTELDGVLWGLDFLRDVNLKRAPKLKDRVLVIGGGNVAIDVVLTALRLGAKEIELACLESTEEMPAFEEEVRQALDEGVKVNVCWGPKRVLGDNGKVTGMELVRCVSVFDKAGKFSPAFDEKVVHSIGTDTVILAIGQSSDLSLLPKDMKKTGEGTIAVDPVTLETSLPGVFAGGDAVLGPASVVQAIASGKRVAISIDRYLKGEDLKAERDAEIKRVKQPPKEGVEKKVRQVMPLLPLDQRQGNFKEVKLGFNEETAFKESLRCMACGSKSTIKYLRDCQTCALCEGECPTEAITCYPAFERRVVTAWP